jgi:asparagine synthase (glutamine-hydrolysing)
VSAIGAVLGIPQTGQGDEGAARFVTLLRPRGPDCTALWTGDDGLVTVLRHQWELAPDFSGEVLLLEQGELLVAADATLYYRDDLRRALSSAGIAPSGTSASHLIAGAYLAWGAEAVSRLEGDFAFLVWDRRQQRLLAARDHAGTRPLFFAWTGRQLIVGSRLSAVAAHPAVSTELNTLALAEIITGSASMAAEETEYRAIRRVPAGHQLDWRPAQSPVLSRFGRPIFFDQGSEGNEADAALALRETLGAAIHERMAADGPTSVWMSGGYDSPAIFALAMDRAAAGQPVIPVSMSYPAGDAGREDELIQAVADFHHRPVQWVSIADVPPMPDAGPWSGRRDEPFAHPYQEWNRQLALGTRQTGARIALTGNGGDQFFSVSPVFLADLFRTGRWLTLRREALALGFGARAYRQLFHWAIQPNLPPIMHRLATRVRGGRPLRAHLQAVLPEWVASPERWAAPLRQRQWHYGLRRPGEAMTSAESHWYLDAAFGMRVMSSVADLSLAEGVETRSPMYDRRVLEFMATRPRRDRFTAAESKGLLRAAVAGLLPAAHLARRTARTGLPGGYLARSLPLVLQGWLDALGDSLRLADLGLVDPAKLRGTLKRYLANPRWESSRGVQVFDVLSAEYWLRSREAGAPGRPSSGSP